MNPEAAEYRSSATEGDTCDDRSIISPTTLASRHGEYGGAVGESSDDALISSSSFRDQPQVEEIDLQQLDKEVGLLRIIIQELLLQSTELDHKILVISNELHLMDSLINDKGCRDTVQKIAEFQEQLKDLEKLESGSESRLLICKEEFSLGLSKSGSIDLDSHLTDIANKLNLLKRELATKMRLNFTLRCQINDVPVQTELIQYERRISELYAQIQEKHRLTRRYYATYNTLLEIKELMLKEASLLNSINLQFKDAMSTSNGRSKLLDSMEVIVKGTKHKLEKANLDLLAEQKVFNSLEEKHSVMVAEERHFSVLLKTFQDACSEFERLQELAST